MSSNWHLGLPGVKSPDSEEKVQCHECGSFFDESEFVAWDGFVCSDCYQLGLKFREWVKSGKGKPQLKNKVPLHKKPQTFDCYDCGEIKYESEMSLDDPYLCNTCSSICEEEEHDDEEWF